MYFVIVLSLLHVSKFANSMDSPPSQHEMELVPFDMSYTIKTQRFLAFTTKDVFLNIEKSLYLRIISEVNEALNMNLEVIRKCVPIQNPSGYYEVPRESLEVCNNECVKLNLKYVAFLNEYISQVKAIFLDALRLGSSSLLKLNPIYNSEIGKCVERSWRVFECQCNLSYQIMIHPLFASIAHIVEGRICAPRDEESAKRQEFTIFVFLLKFHPFSAALYFAYLINKCKLSLTSITVEFPNIPIRDLNTGTQLEGGLIENKGTFFEYEEKVFKWFIEQINRGKFNPRKFAVDNFVNFNPFMLFIIALAILTSIEALIST